MLIYVLANIFSELWVFFMFPGIYKTPTVCLSSLPPSFCQIASAYRLFSSPPPGGERVSQMDVCCSSWLMHLCWQWVGTNAYAILLCMHPSHFHFVVLFWYLSICISWEGFKGYFRLREILLSCYKCSPHLDSSLIPLLYPGTNCTSTQREKHTILLLSTKWNVYKKSPGKVILVTLNFYILPVFEFQIMYVHQYKKNIYIKKIKLGRLLQYLPSIKSLGRKIKV